MSQSDHDLGELFLFHFFTRLRKAGYPLGIPEFIDVLKALQGGFGIGEKDKLLGLCQMLWMPSQDEKYNFEIYFEEVRVSIANKKEEDIQNNSKREETNPSLSDSTDSRLTKSPEALGEDYPGQNDKVSSEINKDSKNSTFDSSQKYLPANLEAPEIKEKVPFFIGSINVERDYLPFQKRKLQQQWRMIRRTKREGIPSELNISSTVEQMAKDQFFIKPILMPPRVNTSNIIFLLDHGGSMVAFDRFGYLISQSAAQGGYFHSVNRFYFYNVPGNVFYTNPSHTDFRLLENVFKRDFATQTLLVVYSDAGAARGHYRKGRIDATREFLNKVKPLIKKIVWLNPLSEERWWDNSAQEIRNMIPGQAMYHADDEGLKKAILFFKGKDKR